MIQFFVSFQVANRQEPTRSCFVMKELYVDSITKKLPTCKNLMDHGLCWFSKSKISHHVTTWWCHNQMDDRKNMAARNGGILKDVTNLQDQYVKIFIL